MWQGRSGGAGAPSLPHYGGKQEGTHWMRWARHCTLHGSNREDLEAQRGFEVGRGAPWTQGKVAAMLLLI